jgi:hypothetical protein
MWLKLLGPLKHIPGYLPSGNLTWKDPPFSS